MMEETNMADIIIVEGKYEIQRSVAPYDISCNVRILKGEKECNLHIEEKRLSEQKKNLILMVLK